MQDQTRTPIVLRPYLKVVLRGTAAIFVFFGAEWLAAYWTPDQEGYGQVQALVTAAVYCVLAGLLIRPSWAGVVALWFVAVDHLRYSIAFLAHEMAPYPSPILGIIICTPYVILLTVPTVRIVMELLRRLRRFWDERVVAALRSALP